MLYRAAAEQFLGAYLRKDWEAFRRLLGPGVVWRFPGREPIGGDAVGPDAVIERARTISAGQSAVALGGILEGSDGFAITLENSLRRVDDAVLEQDVVLTARMTDGLVTTIRSFVSDVTGIAQFYGSTAERQPGGATTVPGARRPLPCGDRVHHQGDQRAWRRVSMSPDKRNSTRKRNTMTTITWYGHAAFTLASGADLLLIDPFLTDNPTAATTSEALDPTAILVTHGHADHLGDALDISKRTGAPIIANYELALFLGRKGANVIPGNIGGTVVAGGARVKFVPAVHSSTVDENDVLVAATAPCGFVVRLGGKTIYVAGDTALFGDMDLIGDESLDVAVIPIGGQYTMDPGDALRAVAKLRPALVIPGHYNTYPPIEQDPHAFAEAVTNAKSRTKATVLDPGQSVTV